MTPAGNCLKKVTWMLGAGIAIAACGGGRTAMLPPSCQILVTPTELDFGKVLPGESGTSTLKVRNVGGADCALTSIAITPSSDSSFTRIGAIEASTIAPGGSLSIGVAFAPVSAKVPLVRTGEIGFDVNAEQRSHVAVALRGEIQSDCRLVVSPTAVDFGHVPLQTPSTQLVRSVEVTNQGTGPCEIRDLALSTTSDKQFQLATQDPFSLEPGEHGFFTVSFLAEDAAKPHHRTGALLFQSNDTTSSKTTVPLSADIDVGCDLSWAPASLDFGNVTLNTTVKGQLSLGNDGSDTCYVSAIALSPDSDRNFSLTSGTSVAVAPGSTAQVNLTFTAADSAPPHRKTGTLSFQTGNQRAPLGQVPLTAYVNSPCVEASQWIYTVDENGLLARFDPNTLKFTDIATLRCPTPAFSTPNSMAVDQNAVAWVAYEDGNMFRVDTSTGECKATGFKPSQHYLTEFGMGFVFDPATGLDTLFIAGGPSISATESTLATVSFPDLIVTPIGKVAAGLPEMSGTGDGQLWGFIPAGAATRGAAALVRLDPKSGKTLESHEYPDITTNGAWAMKFWGGKFWVFLGNAVYKISRDTPERIEPAIRNTGRDGIVGAGVSTCAPL